MSGEACTYMHDYDSSALVVAAPRLMASTVT
jgi:hypothetical protein